MTKKETIELVRKDDQLKKFISKIPYKEMLVLNFSTDEENNPLCTRVEKKKVFIEMLYQNYEYLDQFEDTKVFKDKIHSCVYQLCKGIIVGSWMGCGRNMGRAGVFLDMLLKNYDQHGHINAVFSES